MSRVDPKLRARHPQEPWRWRRDWNAGRLRAADGRTAAVAWLLALCFGGLSAALVPRLSALAAEAGSGVALLALLFPAAALGLLAWACLASARWLRFRGIVLELETLPGVVGGPLRGRVHLPDNLAPEGGFVLLLSCIRRRECEGSGEEGRRVREDVVWQDERRVDAARLLAGPHGRLLPVELSIPFELPPSSPEPGPDVHVWRLEVSAALRGVDLASQFEVPVFRTEQSSSAAGAEPRTAAAPERTPDGGDLITDPLEDPAVRSRLLPTGELELLFRARRNRGAAAVLALFSLICCGVFAAMARPATFPFWLLLIPFAAAGLLLLALTAAVALHSLRVRASSEGVALEHRLAGLRYFSRFVPSAEIADVRVEVRGQTNGRATWGLGLERRSGPPARAGDGLRGKRDAERLAAALRRLVLSR